MAPSPFPYTFYSCPCTGTSSLTTKRISQQIAAPTEDDEGTFDPRSPLANYSLYPLESLHYCNDCKELRCPRCCKEEVVTWYCPQCLFEMTGLGNRTEGGRCNRSCFSCPLCTSPLTVSSLSSSAPDAEADALKNGPFVLLCPYCQWTTLDIGIKFPKFTNLTAQLSLLRNGGKQKKTPSGPMSPLSNIERTPEKGENSPIEEESSEPEDELLERDELFTNLAAFYRSQMAETSSGAGSYADPNYASPSTITRIMNLYTSNRRPKKVQPMRSAHNASEGFEVFPHSASDPASNSELAAIQALQKTGWDGTTTITQRRRQKDDTVHFLDQLRPVNTPLKTKRAKRCKSCNSILYRPDPKPTSYKSKINLVALERIPKVSVRLLSAPTPTFVNHITPSSGPSDYELLKAGKAVHVLLTLTNPLFDALKITLASPATLANGTRITILCPQFQIGANTDIWDEALGPSAASRRRTLFLSGEAGTIEAGKPWEKGRNFTSVIIEMVPMWPSGRDKEGDWDATLLEIPMFVRCEYESEVEEKKAKEKVIEKREDAFWVVLGVGRVIK